MTLLSVNAYGTEKPYFPSNTDIVEPIYTAKAGWYNGRQAVFSRPPNKSIHQQFSLSREEKLSELSALRDNHYSPSMKDVGQLRATSVQESVRQWMWLQIAFEWQLQLTSTLFEQDRRAALVQLQARLQRLAA